MLLIVAHAWPVARQSLRNAKPALFCMFDVADARVRSYVLEGPINQLAKGENASGIQCVVQPEIGLWQFHAQRAFYNVSATLLDQVAEAWGQL